MQSQVGPWAICLLVHPPWYFSEYLLSAKDKTGRALLFLTHPNTPMVVANEKTETESTKWELNLSFPICGSRHQQSHMPLGLWVLSHSSGGGHPLSSPIASHLITARTPGPDGLAVMAATPGCTILPEVDEVHQRVRALDAHKAGRMPLLIVACPVWVDHRSVGWGHSLAELTDLERWGRIQRYKVVRRALSHGFKFWLRSLYCLGDLAQVTLLLCPSVFSSAKWNNNIAYLVGCCEDQIKYLFSTVILKLFVLRTIYTLKN